MSVRKQIEQAITTLQILDLRESGNADLVPAPFAPFTDSQIASAATKQVIALYAEIAERETT